jgi:hypothetical protein
VPAQDAERPVHAIRSHQALEIASLTAGQAQKVPIWAGRLRVDGPPGESQKVGLPLEPPAQGSARLLDADRVPQEGRQAPQEGRQAPQEPRSEGQVLEREQRGETSRHLSQHRIL